MDGQTGRQTNGMTNKQTDVQANRQTERPELKINKITKNRKTDRRTDI